MAADGIFPKDILDRLRASKVVAGFSAETPEEGVKIAQALVASGIDAIELTLRTDAGLEAVKEIAAKVPGVLVGVGTIITPEQARAVKAAGAHFGVAPGLNGRVIRAAQEAGLPFAPGIATPSEIEAALELGCRLVKFFPAEGCGGIKYLAAIAAPYAHLGMQYFPLGGVNAENMCQYLARSDVLAVGGSWIVSKKLVERKDWAGITSRAAEVRAALHALE